MDEIRLKARAKINLGLDVLRRREDGYHEVKMVMQTVDLFDDLSFRKLEEDCILVSTDKEELAGDESNLVYKAVKLVKDTFGIRRGVAADLTKRIPMAAGMAYTTPLSIAFPSPSVAAGPGQTVSSRGCSSAPPA